MSGARVVEATKTAVLVEIVIPHATAAQAYAAVSDIRRMREWSPEGKGWTDSDQPLQAGDVFLGTNRRGRRTWSTTCTVARAESPRAFAFEVTWAGMPGARWGYEFDDTDDCVVAREQWTEGRRGARGLFLRCVGAVATGVWNRAPHNAETMKVTLERLAAALIAEPR